VNPVVLPLLLSGELLRMNVSATALRVVESAWASQGTHARRRANRRGKTMNERQERAASADRASV